MYGKIFESMYEGSLYGQWEAIVTMQQLIVLASADGVIDMTPAAISGKTSIPLDIIEKGLDILSRPDRYSRTQGSDGVRIQLLEEHREWGWFLVNHEKYRDLRTAEDRREYMREYMQKRRAVNNGKQSLAPLANTNKDTDTLKNSLFDEFWHWWPNKQKKKDALKIWKRDKLDHLADKIIEHVRLRPALDPKWKPNAKGETFIPLPTTFLNGERWNDELDSTPAHKPRRPEVVTDAQRQLDREKADRELAELKDRR